MVISLADAHVHVRVRSLKYKLMTNSNSFVPAIFSGSRETVFSYDQKFENVRSGDYLLRFVLDDSDASNGCTVSHQDMHSARLITSTSTSKNFVIL